jgi:hypothetical protein
VNDARDHQFFFVHIMKTGGASFRQHVYAGFAPGEVYPDRSCDDMYRANTSIEYLLSLPAERKAAIRVYTGHFPFLVSEMMGIDFVTLTILRDPVDRTISYLKHCKRYHEHHRDLPLEEIYEDPFFFPCFIQNHQSKIFSMTPDDEFQSFMEVIDVDERRLKLAQENLERIDLLGLNEHYGEFLDGISRRFGWRFTDRPNLRVADEPWTVTPAFRKRIASDNRADMAFYDYARQLHERRRTERA